MDVVDHLVCKRTKIQYIYLVLHARMTNSFFALMLNKMGTKLHIGLTLASR